MAHKLKKKNKNLLLITIDALRLDHLSITGYKKRTTPFIDKLAKRGFFFENAIVNGSCTPSSFSSMFTSIYPFHQGGYSPLPYNKTTIAEVLREKGYKTVAIHSTPLLSRYYGFDKGFDIYYDGMLPDNENPIKKSLFNKLMNKGDVWNKVVNWVEKIHFPKKILYYLQMAFYTKFVGKKEYYENAKSLLQKAYKWLKKHKQKKEKKPFFLWVHLMEPHDPYFPLKKFLRKIKSRNLSLEEIKYIKEHPEYMAILREYGMTPKLLDLYDAEIRFVNAMIRRFIRKLKHKKRNLLKNTIIILTADHGEEFNDHGMYGHRAQLYDEIIRVPLIIFSKELRKLKHINKRGNITNLINMRDLPPTILELLGLPPEQSFEGKSFAHYIFSDEKYTDDPIENGVFSETYHKNRMVWFSNNGDPSIMRLISYRTPKWKYIIDEETRIEELYDLKNDPKEIKDLSKDFPELIKIFRKKLIDHVKNPHETNLDDLIEKKKILCAIKNMKSKIRSLSF